MLCVYVRAPDASEIIPSLCGFFVRDLTLSLGESGSFQVVWDFQMDSDGFSGIFKTTTITTMITTPARRRQDHRQ